MIRIYCKNDYSVEWDKARYADTVGIVIRQLREFHTKIRKYEGIEISYSILVKGKGVALWIDS